MLAMKHRIAVMVVLSAACLAPATHAASRCLAEKSARQAAQAALQQQQHIVIADERSIGNLGVTYVRHHLFKVEASIAAQQGAIATLDAAIAGCARPDSRSCQR